MATSPFEVHRDKILGHYSTAWWLRGVVMAMWNGDGYQVGLSHLVNLDADHFAAFAEMTAHYHRHGENDPAFMALANEVWKRQAEEKAAKDREEKLEKWCSTVKSELRIHGRKSGDLDDHYSWFEGQFNSGMAAAGAVEAFISR